MILALFKRFLGKSRSSHSDKASQIAPEQWIERIKQGDEAARNELIADYHPFIVKATSRFCKRYIDPAADDEYSVALSAFNEAIMQYQPHHGRGFLSFADTVIRMRLIDYVRKEQKFANTVPYSAFEIQDEEDNVLNPIEIRQAMEQYKEQQGSEARQGEITSLHQSLGPFKIQFADLIEAAPKHSDSREALMMVGRMLAEDAEMMELLFNKKLLPIKELLAKVNLSRKTLERNRKYIIAIALIHHGQYPYLQDYIHIEKSTIEESVAHE